MNIKPPPEIGISTLRPDAFTKVKGVERFTIDRPCIVQSRKTEAFLCGSPLEPEVLEMAAELARVAVSPISDVRATKAYRRDVAGRLLMRMDQAVQGAS
ncbi:putative CO dehydrogenase flavoprotein [Desulforapulum autotrophicum HRM2]|jgi:CO/xanthine dehydrogenase FAD-binding subunit|uniref:CO dehydrogenase flavoprotein n=1 Tax=Desulforapulum autotrophicum (strain ATCC 43914 / DSM 3382 / VKM B-1955 / HRM2) TaxID=177437 RepID=C0QMF6_DESAH|nr:hypothetical protein [Desulforapulum autotrophicum]ACN16473.1 putative CO dehydrogenase flavoprotein [Desulforapulum autotrophicum HRM2]